MNFRLLRMYSSFQQSEQRERNPLNQKTYVDTLLIDPEGDVHSCTARCQGQQEYGADGVHALWYRMCISIPEARRRSYNPCRIRYLSDRNLLSVRSERRCCTRSDM